MSDPTPSPESSTTRAARVAEAAAIRRRWITLGEGLAVVAVVISALTLWNNWSARSDSQAEKTAQAHQASTRAARLALMATPSGKRTLILKPAAEAQSIQSQTVTFPTALGAAPAQTTGEPRIEANWFERALEKARKTAGLPDNSRGDERLPIAIETHYLVDDEAHEDIALYDIGYTISGRWLGGHSVTLRGLSLVGHVKSGSAQARVDARWAALVPRK